ncbi:uncharacterized protein LOC111696527 [Eurytemora carolleeae]|uniref:uncharacterized protein LOC111696527 n=1 Tax=Eurytemora carolleeae TaxID=1294199 RepID=UPI000C77541B|nr:uncharacterized protein LOC111696527 [Eurytemora carolleeae]XP_023321915.1 uncharacterized protein LOC111696527 [Eurytemora carolleeae]|eukprot:XP_023321914.1 uncharacterized protein LOC111696527 [Eurytemora affinis]
MKKKPIVSLYLLAYLPYLIAEPMTALTTVYKKTDVVVDSFVKLSSALGFKAANAKTRVQCAAACRLSPPCNGIIFENGVCTLGTAICSGPPKSGNISVYTQGCLNRLVIIKGGGWDGQPEGGHVFYAVSNEAANVGEEGWKEFVSYSNKSSRMLIVNGRWTVRWDFPVLEGLVSFPQYPDVYNNTQSAFSASFYDACPQEGVRMAATTLIRAIFDVLTWQACGVHCAEDFLCEYWTWGTSGSKCHLLSGMWVVIKDLTYISGSKDCTS